MKSGNKINYKFNKSHLSIIHLLIALLVVIVYINESSSMIKGLCILLYFLSLWIVFAFKEVKIMAEEEETDDEIAD